MLLDKYKEDDSVRYIYKIDDVIYGRTNVYNNHYLIIADNIPLEPKKNIIADCNLDKLIERESVSILEEQDPFHYTLYTCISTNDWFRWIEENNIYPWICEAALSKYKPKEYVKINLISDKLKLRKFFDKILNDTLNSIETFIDNRDYINAQKEVWRIILNLKLIIQIIEYGQIVNLRCGINDYLNIVTGEETCIQSLTNELFRRLEPSLNLLHKYTDEVLKNEKIKKYLNDKK